MDEVVNGIRFRRKCSRHDSCRRPAEPGWKCCVVCRESDRRSAFRRRRETPDAFARWERTYNARLRHDILAAYGGRCAWCGEDDRELLTLDHIHGDGAEEKRRLGARKSKSNRGVLVMLRKEGYPKGRHRLLCYNCNCGRDKSKDPSFEARRRALGEARKGGQDGTEGG